MRVVLDANVWISALISTNGAPAKIVDLWLAGKFDVAISSVTFKEFLAVIQYEKIARISGVPEYGRKIADLISKLAIWVEPKMKITASQDDSDNRYIECAIAAQADYLITGDAKHLLPIEKYNGIQIIPPDVFLMILNRV